MRVQPRIAIRFFTAWMFACLVALAAGGCVGKKPAVEEPSAGTAITVETLDVNEAYSRGLEAFWRGEYILAGALFESVARKVDDQAYRAKALYGLACARLASASDAQELKAALDTWLEWEKSVIAQEGQIDPRMLTPFVRSVKLNAPPAKDVREGKAQAVISKPAATDQDLAKRLQEKEKEVLHLQKQIKALETIHREIQEKKKMSAQ